MWITHRDKKQLPNYNFVIIRQYGIQDNKMTKYSVITYKNKMKIPYQEFTNELKTFMKPYLVKPHITMSPLQHFIRNFKERKPKLIIDPNEKTIVLKNVKITRKRKRCPKGTRKNSKNICTPTK